MSIMSERVQTQTSKGKIDRIFAVVYPPTAPDEPKLLRGTWFRAKDRLHADSGLAMLRSLCLLAARKGKGRKCLKALDYRKGADIHVAHREVEPKITRDK